MKRVIIISTIVIGLNCYAQQDSGVKYNIQTDKSLNKYVIPEEEKRNAFEEIVEDASRKIKEWAKKVKVSYSDEMKDKSKSKETSVKNGNNPRSFEEELNSKEWIDERDKLFKYLSAWDAENVRKQLEIIRQKFPALVKGDPLGFKFNEAKAFIFEKKYSEAKKLLTEIINEINKQYPDIKDMEKLNMHDKLFYVEVRVKRGIINLFYENNFLDAADDLETGLKLIPKYEKDLNYERTYSHLVSALVYSHRTKEAAIWYKKAFEVYPDFHKRPNEHTNLCKNIINGGYLELCPPCKDVADNMGK